MSDLTSYPALAAASLPNPSFAAYAELGIVVERPGDIRGALDRAIAHDGPALVEVIQDAELL